MATSGRRLFPSPSIWSSASTERSEKKNQFYYPSDLWARVLFSFAVAYRNNGGVDRGEMIESMIPFYHSRILSYVNKTDEFNTKEAEEYLENINRVFEREKYYLIARWNQARKRLGSMLIP